MATKQDLDNLRQLVRELETVLEGRGFEQVLGALGVLLTRFIAAIPREKRQEVFEFIIEGVTEDAVRGEARWDFTGWRQ